jgi:hypothetical protein
MKHKIFTSTLALVCAIASQKALGAPEANFAGVGVPGGVAAGGAAPAAGVVPGSASAPAAPVPMVALSALENQKFSPVTIEFKGKKKEIPAVEFEKMWKEFLGMIRNKSKDMKEVPENLVQQIRDKIVRTVIEQAMWLLMAEDANLANDPEVKQAIEKARQAILAKFMKDRVSRQHA